MNIRFTVRDYMTSKLITLTADMDILQAGRVLLDNDISGAPVVNEDGALLGIITEKDFFRTTLQAGYYDEMGGKVSDFMTHEVMTVGPDVNILDMADMFLNSKYRRYPVVEDNKLTGLISRQDVLRALHALSWPEK